MDLTGNRLSGTIPASTAVTEGLANALLIGLGIGAMRRLSLATNLLDGTIPEGLWRFRLQARSLCVRHLHWLEAWQPQISVISYSAIL